MSRKKLQMTIAAVMTMMLMSGCGEAPYELTEAEEELIVDYSAHVVTKYNTYQKEGLTYVWPEETEETEESVVASEVVEEETENIQVSSEVSSVPADGGEQEPVSTGVTATLTELFGNENLDVSFIGATLTDSYVKDSYYALYPDSGKQYLILGIDVTNNGETAEEIDYLSDTSQFEVTLNGQYRAKAETTILMEDFAGYETQLEAGMTGETVLLFQVSDDISEIEQVDLVVISDQNYEILLESN